MKSLKTIFASMVGAILVGLPSLAISAPFLVCDPYTATTDPLAQAKTFNITIDGAAPVASAAVVNADGTQVMHYDLAGMAVGQHTFVATVTNGYGTSAASAPFAWSGPVILAAPGLHVSDK